MSSAVIENPISVSASDPNALESPRSRKASLVFGETDVMCELGIWLSGLESFLAAGNNALVDSGSSKVHDSSKQFRLTHSTLLRCSKLTSRLLNIRYQTENDTVGPASGIRRDELDQFSLALRDCVVLSESMLRAEPLGLAEWKAWADILLIKFSGLAAFRKFIIFAERSGEEFLPDSLKRLSRGTSISVEHAELSLVLPRFARILKWLSVVGKMLDADEPLKPALLIFSRLNEQITDLISYINNRLERFPNEGAELFASLDAASYTASVELKKVYTQELTGISAMRPSPSIYARMETAYALLNESFQQTLAGFARLLDPKADIFVLFPNFKSKFDHSLALRRELFAIVQLVQTAEKDPDKPNVDSMNKTLREFMKGTVRHLFYKDSETVERFVEEILVTKQKKDLVPILHRFGAYLETLLGQVNMRAVLENHPFDPHK